MDFNVEKICPPLCEESFTEDVSGVFAFEVRIVASNWINHLAPTHTIAIIITIIITITTITIIAIIITIIIKSLTAGLTPHPVILYLTAKNMVPKWIHLV